MHTLRVTTTLAGSAPSRTLHWGREMNLFRLKHTVLHQLHEQERLQEPTQVQNQQLQQWLLQQQQQPSVVFPLDEGARMISPAFPLQYYNTGEQVFMVYNISESFLSCQGCKYRTHAFLTIPFQWSEQCPGWYCTDNWPIRLAAVLGECVLWLHRFTSTDLKI